MKKINLYKYNDIEDNACLYSPVKLASVTEEYVAMVRLIADPGYDLFDGADRVKVIDVNNTEEDIAKWQEVEEIITDDSNDQTESDSQEEISNDEQPVEESEESEESEDNSIDNKNNTSFNKLDPLGILKNVSRGS